MLITLPERYHLMTVDAVKDRRAAVAPLFELTVLPFSVFEQSYLAVSSLLKVMKTLFPAIEVDEAYAVKLKYGVVGICDIVVDERFWTDVLAK